MNVEANLVSENWEKLFKKIRECSYGYGSVDLSDSVADRYDFANEILMPRMRERLVAELQSLQRVRVTSMRMINLSFGNKFFMTMNEQQQQSFFHSIFNLRVQGITVGEETDNTTESPAITINTSALLETLPHLNEDVGRLSVNNFALTRQSDVQTLSNIIGSKRATLHFLWLHSIECPVDGCSKQGSDGPDGFLDPLFYAASGLESFCVSTKTRCVHSTLVSPTALRAMFVEGNDDCELSLRGLGLTDSHVLAIVDGLSTPGHHVRYLMLMSNPGITGQGYGALLNVISQANVIDRVFLCKWDEPDESCVDEKAWEAKIRLVSEMNSDYGRLEYMANGTFTSEERRFDWLERVVNLPIPDYYECYKKKEEWDAKHLNFIWYTLCQNPGMMQT
jgi:hypothetical protein